MRKISFRNDVLPLKDVIFRLALRITQNRAEAEDITQDTLIQMWNLRERWEQIESLEAYSLRICRNMAIDRTKKMGHYGDTLETTQQDELTDTARTPLERAQQRDSIETVRKLVDSLPEKQRSCMQLRDFEGKSYKEIASILSISEEQVKVNIFRARQTIKQRFQEFDNYGL